MPVDNSSLEFKSKQRREVCETIGRPPVVLEAYGEFGIVFGRAYREFDAWGVTLDKDQKKVHHLAVQRPNWIVCRGDSARLIEAGLCGWMPFDILDVDAWGSPWPVVLGFFKSERAIKSPLWIVATDGSPYHLSLTGHVKVLQGLTEKYGEKQVRQKYPAIARELLETESSRNGWVVADWKYTQIKKLAHWTARLER